MRLVMMGTGGFALPTFRALYDTSHTVALLVTQPLREVHDRRRKVVQPLRELALERQTPLIDPENVNTDAARAEIAEFQPDLLVVCAYGQILDRQTLGVARHGGINLHSSLLPRYRGAAPINWAIYHGETQTGVTVIHMTEKVDAGPCIAQATIDILPEETADQLAGRLADAGAWLTCRAIDNIAAGIIQEIPQDPALATRAPKLKKSHGQVDWTRPAEAIRNQVRAMKPWPKTFTSLVGARSEPLGMILDEVSIVPLEEPAAPGTIIQADKQQLVVATGAGGLRIDRLQPTGKRVMSAEEFLNGHPLRPGERLGEW